MSSLPLRTLVSTAAVTALLAGGAGVSIGLRWSDRSAAPDLVDSTLADMRPLLALPASNDPALGPTLARQRESSSQKLLLLYAQANPAQQAQIRQLLAQALASGWFDADGQPLVQHSLHCMQAQPDTPLQHCLRQAALPTPLPTTAGDAAGS
jgi:hypothetical protein